MKTEVRMSIRLAGLGSLAAILGIGWYGIFVLPYSFPQKVPVFDSPSYNVGFKNSANSQSKCNTGKVVCERKRSRFWGNLGESAAMKYLQFNAEERSALATLRRLGMSR